jgi:hypothetical protein
MRTREPAICMRCGKFKRVVFRPDVGFDTPVYETDGFCCDVEGENIPFCNYWDMPLPEQCIMQVEYAVLRPKNED